MKTGKTQMAGTLNPTIAIIQKTKIFQ